MIPNSGLIKFIQKRPSDLTIRIGRVVFGSLLVGVLYYNLIIQGDKLDNDFFWINLDPQIVEYIKYFFISIGLVPVVMGAFNICLFKKKYIRIIQIIFGILLFYIANQIIPLDPDSLDVDVLIGFLGILPLFAGITGKCITSNCLKYKEKITKIRV